MKAQVATTLLVTLLAATGTWAQPPDAQPGDVELQINGTFTDAAHGRGVFSGDVDLSRFKAEVQSGAVVVLGTLTGVLADSEGTPMGRVDQQVVLPVSIQRATCELLHLEFGPVEVDISGVAVHLQKVTIGVTGRYGPKPAFGALLCSTAKVVGSNPPTDAVAAALNDVLHLMALPKYFRPSRES